MTIKSQIEVEIDLEPPDCNQKEADNSENPRRFSW